MLNRKTGEYEIRDHIYVRTEIYRKNEHAQAEKRTSSRTEVVNNPSAKAAAAAKQKVVSFVEMAADDEFFSKDIRYKHLAFFPDGILLFLSPGPLDILYLYFRMVRYLYR